MSLSLALEKLPEAPEAALQHLCDAWRDQRVEAIADRIVRLSQILTRPRAPIDSLARWSIVAERKEAVDVERLLAAMPRVASATVARFALLHLVRWRADPRVTAAIVALLPSLADEATGVPLLNALERMADPAVLPALRRLLEAAVHDQPHLPRARLGAVVAGLEKVAAALPALSASDERILSAIDAGIAQVAAELADRAPAENEPLQNPRGRARRAKLATDGDTVGSLQQASASLPDDPARALQHLLAAWRVDRVPALADRIDRLTEIAAREREPLIGRTQKALHELWLTVEERRDPVDVPRLEAVLDQPPANLAAVRMRLFEVWPEDPRLAAAMVRLIDRFPWTSSSTRRFWTPVFRLLVDIGDVRVLDSLEQILARHRAGNLTGGNWIDYRREKVESTVAKLRARFPTAPILDGEQAAALAVLDARLATLIAPARTLEGFLHGIWTAPDDDEARLVFADWLQERGDPRGEFITLQFQREQGALAPAAERRERQLLKEHGRAWLGPLDGVVARMGVHWRRGFVDSVWIDAARSSQLEALIDHPAWSTVKRYAIVSLDERLRARFTARMAARGASEMKLVTHQDELDR